MSKKKRKQKQKSVKRPSKGMSSNGTIFLAAGVLLAVVFLPTTLFLSVAMLPTAVAFLTDRLKRKTKAITVGAMNLAGSLPFMLELWMHGHSFDKAFSIVVDLKSMIVVYAAAAVGYLIDWSMTGIVANILVQRGRARKKAIKKRQQELVKRWGVEVTGEVPMDPQGFKLESAKTAKDDKGSVAEPSEEAAS